MYSPTEEEREILFNKIYNSFNKEGVNLKVEYYSNHGFNKEPIFHLKNLDNNVIVNLNIHRNMEIHLLNDNVRFYYTEEDCFNKFINVAISYGREFVLKDEKFF